MADKDNDKQDEGKQPKQKAKLDKRGHFEGDTPNDPMIQPTDKQ